MPFSVQHTAFFQVDKLAQFQDELLRPAILMDCGVHAREWVSVSFCLHSIQQLTAQNGLLKRFDFHIIPVANPDGYVYSHTTGRKTINSS